MNISKFTQKSIQAVQDTEKLAYEYGNQEIEEEHLLVALSAGGMGGFSRGSAALAHHASQPRAWLYAPQSGFRLVPAHRGGRGAGHHGLSWRPSILCGHFLQLFRSGK